MASFVDWEGVLWDTVTHLQALIRMETVNPPGLELRVARYLDDVLRGAGIATTLLEPAPERAALVARIPGEGRGRPLLLLAHMDVVAVEPERWTMQPFGGEVQKGNISISATRTFAPKPAPPLVDLLTTIAPGSLTSIQTTYTSPSGPTAGTDPCPRKQGAEYVLIWTGGEKLAPAFVDRENITRLTPIAHPC